MSFLTTREKINGMHNAFKRVAKINAFTVVLIFIFTRLLEFYFKCLLTLKNVSFFFISKKFFQGIFCELENTFKCVFLS